MDAAFDSLLVAARTEALNLLRALLTTTDDTPPALLRERRLAACAILSVKRTPSPSGGGSGRGTKSDGAERTSASQTASPTESERGTRAAAQEPGRRARPNRAPPLRAVASPASRLLARVGADTG